MSLTFLICSIEKRKIDFESDWIPLFAQKSPPEMTGVHFPLYFWPILCKNVQIPLFFTSNSWLNMKLSYILPDQKVNILYKYAMNNHYTKGQPFRLKTDRERAILSIGVHLAPPGDLSLIRYPVSYRVKYGLLFIKVKFSKPPIILTPNHTPIHLSSLKNFKEPDLRFWI